MNMELDNLLFQKEFVSVPKGIQVVTLMITLLFYDDEINFINMEVNNLHFQKEFIPFPEEIQVVTLMITSDDFCFLKWWKQYHQYETEQYHLSKGFRFGSQGIQIVT